MNLHVRPLSRAAALEIIRWRYPPPYDVYNLVDGAVIAAFLKSQQGSNCFQIETESGNVVAFCCFGEDAQVPGPYYPSPWLDVGLGVRPDLTGQGQGMHYFSAILAFAHAHFATSLLRLTVAAWNRRAQRLYERAGFTTIERVRSPFSDEEFLVMVLD
ncbi:GNAT family N-acetyltransferase [Candidatus Viridilinea mediisalina]|uniref:N-acetyltransferase domain-containing protein n=1 Tax=Candidatus Viridilinea mediisalina TaxID=2024553 RepID=A0A2A6RHW4_9CHLR|nr:GNAT family N-acetyltransferase [Candidatus Viridilinea mediisalina]PDW02469.1 hypothetical protein CJ255_13765 [Candidatus Viridilinea mediisalina]